MKKIITLLAITTAIIATLSGCSEKQSFNPASTAPDTEFEISPEFDFQFPFYLDTESKESTIPVTANNSPDVGKTPEQSYGLIKYDTPVTTKPEISTAAKPSVSTTKPETIPSTNSKGITSGDIKSFYPDNSNTVELAIGETHKPGASIWLMDESGKAYSSDKSVVTVNSNGVVTATGEGTAYIKIVGSTGMSQMYRYTVNASGITENDITGFYPDYFNTLELAVGETHKPSASIWLKNGNGKVYSSDKSVVTVNSNGVVTATGEGTAYVKIVGSTGMSEMYMYVVGSDNNHQNVFETFFGSFQW